MQLENTFTVAAPIEKAWEALNTPQTIAPCLPGATLTEYEGDTFTGTVKVKLGPISLTYKGKGVYMERDDAAHRVVIDASGRDSRGNGTAEATVTGTMAADGPDKTAVTMVTDMKITGRPAQFGRGVISDVADKIIGQFASCVASKLQAGDAPSEEASSEGSAPVPAGGARVGVRGGCRVVQRLDRLGRHRDRSGRSGCDGQAQCGVDGADEERDRRDRPPRHGRCPGDQAAGPGGRRPGAPAPGDLPDPPTAFQLIRRAPGRRPRWPGVRAATGRPWPARPPSARRPSRTGR